VAAIVSGGNVEMETIEQFRRARKEPAGGAEATGS
jgi:hypothetical protein